jgi:hypothetical protein
MAPHNFAAGRAKGFLAQTFTDFDFFQQSFTRILNKASQNLFKTRDKRRFSNGSCGFKALSLNR